MSSSARLPTSLSAGASRGAVIAIPPFRVSSVLPFRHPDNQAVERLADLDLAGETRIGVDQRGKAQHGGFLRAGDAQACCAEPALVDVDVAGRTGALAAAVGVDAGDVVVDGTAHDRASERHFGPVLAPAIFDVGDLWHVGGYPLILEPAP